MASKTVVSNCGSCERYSVAVEEQKAKLTLLETRLKDVLRAYKLLAREKEALQAVANSSIVNAGERVDATQQRRIADLEETVLQLTAICGRVEVERAADRETISRLEAECDRLREQTKRSSQEPETSTEVQKKAPEVVLPRSPKDLRNKACQTTVKDSSFSKSSPSPVTEDKACQTFEEDRGEEGHLLKQHQPRLPNTPKSFETAVVSPFTQRRREGRSISETIVDEDGEEDKGEDHHQEYEEEDQDDLHHQGHQQQIINSTNNNSAPLPPEGSTSLFYVNELARRELELAEYKLRVREHECSIRELQWKYSNEKYRLQSRIADLELLNSNFMNTSNKATTSTVERSSTTTGTGTTSSTTMSTVNVAYVRNVLTKLLETKDREQKAIMINALLTALNSFH